MRLTSKYQEPSPEPRKHRPAQESPIHGNNEARIKWKRDDIITQKRYFVKFDEPINSMSDQEIVEHRDRIIDSVQGRRHIPSADYKDKEKAVYAPQHVEKGKWEQPKSKYCFFTNARKSDKNFQFFDDSRKSTEVLTVTRDRHRQGEAIYC